MSAREKTLEPTLVSLEVSGEATARHYQTGEPLCFTWEAGILQSIKPASTEEAGDLWIAPGLLDLQVNGYAGVDFQQDPGEISEEGLLKAVRALQRDGCPRILLTLITAPWEKLKVGITEYRRIIQSNPELRQAIVGWHIEGPFLSDQPGFSGAHHPEWMTDPTPEKIRELRSWVGQDPVLLTLAPERGGSIEAIREAVQAGFLPSAGHSNASRQALQEAADAGLRAFTHLANGCPQQLDRHDNILWRVIEESRLVAGLIPDGIHVSPALFRLLHQALGRERIYWTTDAMSAAGAPSGRYSLGSIDLMVGDDRIVRHPVTKTFAGSALEPIEGIRRGAHMLETSWRHVWDYFSVHPARLINLPCDLSPGSPAGFCLIREN